MSAYMRCRRAQHIKLIIRLTRWITRRWTWWDVSCHIYGRTAAVWGHLKCGRRPNSLLRRNWISDFRLSTKLCLLRSQATHNRILEVHAHTCGPRACGLNRSRGLAQVLTLGEEHLKFCYCPGTRYFSTSETAPEHLALSWFWSHI